MEPTGIEPVTSCLQNICGNPRFPHQVRPFAEKSAWGAWEGLFLPELVGQDVRVRSSCPISEEPIRLEVRRDGAVSTDLAVLLFLLLPPEGTALHETDRDDYCRFVCFFSTAAAGEAGFRVRVVTRNATWSFQLRSGKRYPSNR